MSQPDVRGSVIRAFPAYSEWFLACYSLSLHLVSKITLKCRFRGLGDPKEFWGFCFGLVFELLMLLENVIGL